MKHLKNLNLRALFLCLLGLGLAGVSVGSAQAEKPNFIVFLVDDLGWMDASCQGSTYYDTPNIDRLAAAGMRFTDGYASCAVCSPTRASVMTGRYPARIGVTDWIHSRFQGGKIPADGKNPSGWTNREGYLLPQNKLWLDAEEVTIAEALKPQGYVSAHVGKWHLGMDAYYPTKQGFDYNFGGCDYGQPPSYFDPYNNPNAKHPMVQAGIPSLPSRKPGEYLTDREADEATGFIRNHKNEPFFLHLANYAVHTPIQSRKYYSDEYAAKPRDEQFSQAYAGMLKSVDDCVGQVLDTLDELNLTGNTVVIFTGDNGGLDRNGGPTDNAPLRSGKGFAYEGGVRVPFIISWPGVTKPGSVSAEPIVSVDIYPTLAAAAGVGPSEHAIDGVDLKPLLAGGELNREAIFWHFPHYRHNPGPYSMIRKGEYKLIKWYVGNRFDLYDLRKDIGEANNLAAHMPELVASLDAELVAHLKDVGAKIPRKAEPKAAVKPKAP